jgi:3-oxoacyl-[acyl-carrier-protein] synthase III
VNGHDGTRPSWDAPPLSILGMGVELPPAVDVRALAESHGADVSRYFSWDRVCRARPVDQPSSLASTALERALADSGVHASELRIVVFAGVSRDYLPSWSVATEVMKLHGVNDGCVGLDVTIGCLGSLAALEVVHGWLAVRGGGYGAIVMGERWSHTVDLSNANTAAMWAWADGGSAIVVAMGSQRPSIAEFLGAEFTSQSDSNGHVLVPYGGTREPIAPPGVDPFARRVSDRNRRDVKASYDRGYQQSYRALTDRLGIVGTRLVCNQITPPTVQMIAAGLGFEMERVVITGNETGHLGASDAVMGLRHLQAANCLDGPIVVAASTAYAFGTGIVVPGTRPTTSSGRAPSGKG